MDKGPVVAIGVFDGVHRGHQEVLARAKKLADSIHTELVVASFDPHPLSVVAPAHAPQLLTDPLEREALLRSNGADSVVFIAFTPDVAALSPEDFVRTYIVDSWKASAIVVGENFRFGRGAAGNVDMLTEMGREWGFSVYALPLAADSAPWSSTRVRAHLQAGEIAEARAILGRPVVISARVVHGDHRGRELGYPTANLDVPNKALPGDGIYAGWAHWSTETGDAVRLPAAISLGTNPQFGGRERRVEAYVLDLPEAMSNLYDRVVTLEFLGKIRDQVVFPDLEGYLEQMPRDIEAVRSLC